MAIHMIQAWGGKDWHGPLWPSARAPQWAKTAGERMKYMGVSEDQINVTLKAMRAERVKVTYKIGDREYDIVVE